MPSVCIIMGSDSDLPVVEKAHKHLADLGIEAAMHVASAHHTPARVHEIVATAEENGGKVFICAAGSAAHLAGAVAAATTRPVIGMPLASGALGGVDALYSTVNMPAGLPVATVSVGDASAQNAALLAAQILAVADDELAAKLRDDRSAQRDAVLEKDSALQAKLAEG